MRRATPLLAGEVRALEGGLQIVEIVGGRANHLGDLCIRITPLRRRSAADDEVRGGSGRARPALQATSGVRTTDERCALDRGAHERSCRSGRGDRGGPARRATAGAPRRGVACAARGPDSDPGVARTTFEPRGDRHDRPQRDPYWAASDALARRRGIDQRQLLERLDDLGPPGRRFRGGGRSSRGSAGGAGVVHVGSERLARAARACSSKSEATVEEAAVRRRW